MAWSLKNTVQSELVRNSARLLSANVIAQAIGLLMYPILTRMYAPEDFGLMNLFLSIGGILALISTCDYQNAIVLPKEGRRAHAIVQVCGLLLALVTGLLLISIPFSNPIARLFNAPGLAQWWWLMPVYVFAQGMWQVLNNCFTRIKAFSSIAVYQISQSFISVGAKLGMGLAGWLSAGLLVSSVFAPYIAILCSLYKEGMQHASEVFHIDYTRCRQEANCYRNFPCYSMPRSLISTLSGNLPILMLTPVFGLTELGYFGMALALAFRPVQMLVQSIYQVLFQHTAELVNNRRPIGSLLFGYIAKASLVLIPSFAVLYLILPWLTGWLLGDEWRISGEYIRLMLPWLLIMGIAAPIGFITDVFGKQKIAFLIEIIYLLSSAGALLVGIALDNFRWTIVCYSLVGFAVILGQTIWYSWLIRRYDRSLTA